MLVILKQDFPSLGYVGDQVNVRRGYARNYLIPRGVAVEIASRNAAVVSHRMAGIAAHKSKLKLKAQELGQELTNKAKLEFTLKIGGQNKSFGSVSARDIELALVEQGFKLDRKQIRLHEAIKSGGEFVVTIKLHSEVSIDLPVKVTVERPAAIEASAEGDRRGRRRSGRGRAKDGDANDEGHDAGDSAGSEQAEKSEAPTSADKVH